MKTKKALEYMCRISRASSLQQIAELAYELLGNPIFISDMSHTVMVYTKSVDIDHPSWQYNVVKAQIPQTMLLQDRRVNAVNSSSVENREPVLVDDDTLPFPRIIKIMVSNGNPVGIVVLTAYLSSFSDCDIELIELLCSYILPIMEREQHYKFAGDKSVENYFIKLLDGVDHTKKQILDWLKNLGYSAKSFLYVLTICLREDADSNTTFDISTILEAFSQIPHCRAFLYGSNMVCILGSEQEILDWETSMPQVSDMLKKWQLVAGISRRFNSPHQVRDHYVQALHALELGRILKRRSCFLVYDYLSIFHVLQSLPQTSLKQYCHQKICDLATYDLEHDSELCKTLLVYLENQKSLSKTAELLFIHRNTVHYRIAKCMEVLDNNLDSGYEMFVYTFSLHIVEYERRLMPHSRDNQNKSELES